MENNDKNIIYERKCGGKFIPLPIEGLNVCGGKRGIILHNPPPKIVSTWEIDEEAWLAQKRLDHEYNAQIFEESDLKLPAELYSKYKAEARIEQFREFKSGQGNLLVQDEVSGNMFWVNDLGQLVSELRRPVSYEVLHDAIIDIRRDYLLIWDKQLNAFCRNLPLPSTKLARMQHNTSPIEQYNEQMELMYIYPSMSSAAEAISTSPSNIDDAAKRHRPVGEYFFRYFYDNDFAANKFKFVQMRDGYAVNRFKSVKEASELLGIPTYTLYRMLKNPNYIDRYGCQWLKEN